MNRARYSHAITRISLVLLPWFILAVTLAATWFIWDQERQATRKALRSQFDFALRETVSRIEQRVLGYEQMLHGVQALFATTPLENHAAMHRYVEALQLDANFSGIQVIGLVEAIKPDRERAFHAPIIQREPHEGGNRAPLGYDVWSDPVRRSALERARDSGMAAISGKVRLTEDFDPASGPAPAGFVMYLPVYAYDQAHDSLEQRRAQLIGWVYAAFHMNDFMASLYGHQPPGLTLAIHDGTDITDASLLYLSDASVAMGASQRQAAVSVNEYMVVAGHNWTLSLRTQEAFEKRYGRGMEVVTAGAGITLSFLLALLAWLMVNGRERALHLAAAMTEELRHMAQHDPLTQLPNRALFSDRLQQELARAKRQRGCFAVVFIDLDHFKPINDNYGHDVGDRVLQQVAKRLQDCVRATDTVGRIGGDEFVVLLAELNDSDFATVLAEKLRNALHPRFMASRHELHVSCSVGVAIYPEDGTDMVTLMKNADDAMYRAKATGRDCVQLSNSTLGQFS